MSYCEERDQHEFPTISNDITSGSFTTSILPISHKVHYWPWAEPLSDVLSEIVVLKSNYYFSFSEIENWER